MSKTPEQKQEISKLAKIILRANELFDEHVDVENKENRARWLAENIISAGYRKP